MLDRARKGAQPLDGGFSLVELLIVVIIMGILAAIAVPLFMLQRAKAEDAAARQDVKSLATEITAFWLDHENSADLAVTYSAADGQYTIASTVAGEAPAVTPASRNIAGVNYAHLGTGPKGNTWCVSVTNSLGVKKVFSVSAATGAREADAAEC